MCDGHELIDLNPSASAAAPAAAAPAAAPAVAATTKRLHLYSSHSKTRTTHFTTSTMHER
jgi:hypothetical protein